VNYIERLTGMRTDELVDVLQDCEAWRELDPQPSDYRVRGGGLESHQVQRLPNKFIGIALTL